MTARTGRRPSASSARSARSGNPAGRDRRPAPDKQQPDEQQHDQQLDKQQPNDQQHGEQADPRSVARQIVLRQLAAAPRTRADLARVLARRGVPGEAATEVLDRFTELRLIDDAEYARMWVASRQGRRGLSRAVLARELREKGVAAEVVTEAVGVVGEDDELAAATALVERRARAMAGDDPARRERRLLAMLARRGYTAEMARRALAGAGVRGDLSADGDASWS